MEINFTPKNPKMFECTRCDFSCSNKKDFKRHLSTDKHRSSKVEHNLEIMEIDFTPKNLKQFKCLNCQKNYKTYSGLWKHKKKCFVTYDKNIIIKENNNDMKDLVYKLIDENKELRNQITELIPKVGNNNNTIKQKFNINVFLNEKCKDAISMDEFIEKIDISLKNLLTTSEKGQTEGISNIILENMNKLSLYERPIHCTDKKRETLYIKNNEWVHDKNLENVDKMIKQVEHKQLQNIKKWIDEHPNYDKSEKEKDEFTVMLRECSKSIDDGREKVIKTLCGELYVDKE